MILTFDNPVALTGDADGPRSAPGSAGKTTDGGLFSQILSTQEAISFAADKAGELLPPVGQESSSGTLLPGGGKELPALPVGEIELASLALADSLQTPAGEALEAALPTPIARPVAGPLIPPSLPDSTVQLRENNGLIANTETLISSAPFEPLSEASRPGDSAVEQGAKLPSLSIANSVTPELAAANSAASVAPTSVPPAAPLPAPLSAPFQAPPTVPPVSASIAPSAVQTSMSAARKPLVPVQDVAPIAKSDQVFAGGFGAAAASAAPIAQKPEMSLVTEDVPVELTQALKVTDGLSHKSAGGNTSPGSQPLPLGMGQNVNEASSASGLRAAATTSLPTPVSDPNWNQEFVGRMGVLVDKGVSEAKLQLTPAELGRMEVKISTEGDQTKILFTVQNATAREAIEQAMPRLREMLGQEGLQLAHSEVADHSAAGDEKRNLNAENHATDSDFLEEELDEFLPHSVELRADSMVDYYV